jgi:hypothetical protein
LGLAGWAQKAFNCHMLAAGGASQAPGFWLAVVVVLAVTVPIAIAVACIVLRRRPRYQLSYCPRKPKQLSGGSWEVNIDLSSRGRRDITSEAFGNKQPIEFGIGTPIRELTVISSPAARPIVEHHAEGTRLLVGPGLIGRRQDLRFTVITDREPRAVTQQSGFIDFPVELTDFSPRVKWLLSSAGILFAYFIVAIIVLAVLGVSQLVGIAAFVFGFIPFGLWIFYRRIPKTFE